MSKNNEDILGFLYRTAVGRAVLKLLTARWISRLAGAYCNSPMSKPLVKRFIRNNNIDLAEFKKSEFLCFNDCFTREIKENFRPVCMDSSALVAPCDGLLSAYKIKSDTVFPAKQSSYTLTSLLNDAKLAEEFEDGILLVFRLCVNHYHRYCYVDNGVKGENIFIPGKLHTVRPIALETHSVFCENCREYTVMETENFGKIVQCEIGAMLVGKIKNHDGAGPFKKGAEKGMFEYGGSTVVLILKKDAVIIPENYFKSTDNCEEIPVKYGEIIAESTIKIPSYI